MNRGHVWLTNENKEWLELLRIIYLFEADRVAGPGSNHRDIQTVLWTREELINSDSAISKQSAELDKLLKWLEDNRQLLVVRSDEKAARYLTRVAEIVRLLGHTYEYWYRGRSGIEATRWLIERKVVPRRDICAKEALDRLRIMVETEIGKGPNWFNLEEAVNDVVKGIGSFLSPKNWEEARFSEFQINATEEMLRSQYKPGHEKRTQILTAGVGSGKTIGFTMGMMIAALESIRGGRDSKRCHLFLYPRTALAQDQASKLQAMANHIPLLKDQVHFEHYEHYRRKGVSVKQGIKQVYGGSSFPAIIITTLETLKRRLQQPPYARVMSSRLSRVIVDEIHLIEGLTGTQIVNLIRRLKAITPRNALLWTGSSATVACPERHASTVFGVKESDVEVIEPGTDVTQSEGLVHHVFLKPNGKLATLGTLVNATSILVHNRRDDVGKRADKPNDVFKTLGFADNLDILGRWNEDLRENERTENDFSRRWGRKHAMSPNIDDWDARQREIPYALRYHDPLVRRLLVPECKDVPYKRLPLPATPNICERCRQGERFILGNADPDAMNALARLVYRNPSIQKDSVERFNIDNPHVFGTTSEVGTLDLCPYLRAGACFWFPSDSFDTAPIPGLKNFHEFCSSARSRIYSSKVGNAASEDDDLGSRAFQAAVRDVYGPFGRGIQADNNIPVDIVLSSPSLEVGIDLQNVTESFLFKAIRNVSSYRQKVGRAGRELGTDTVNVTLLSARSTDFHYYRQPRKLISARILEPVPLKSDNPQIMRSTAYMAIWDLLALKAQLPESIPRATGRSGRSEFAERIELCLKYLHDQRKDVLAHLRGLSSGLLKSQELEECVRKVEAELSIFLMSTKDFILDNKVTCLADWVVTRLGHQVSPTPRMSRELTKASRRIDTSEKKYDMERPDIDPMSLGLHRAFEILDRMRSCGWDRQKLKDAIEQLRPQKDKLKYIWNELEAILDSLEDIEHQGPPIVPFFIQQFIKAFNDRNRQSRAYYLSYILEDLPLFTLFDEGLRFPRPKNLFTNPFEESVSIREVIRQQNGIVGRPWERERALISEVLYSYVPGTWTYRMGLPMKVEVGDLEPRAHVLQANLSQLTKRGSYSELARGIAGPPIFGPDLIDIYQPQALTVHRASKYLNADLVTGRIIDHDENEHSGYTATSQQVKVPKCFIEGWTHINPGELFSIYVAALHDDRMRFTSDNGEKHKSLLPRINHPLQHRLISDTRWIPDLEVLEYVYSVNRSYSSRNIAGTTIMFFDDQNMQDIGLGRKIKTEGVAIDLEPGTVKETLSCIKKGVMSGTYWAVSSCQAFRALLNRVHLEDGVNISPFHVKDITSIVLYSMIDQLEDVTFINLVDRLKELVDDKKRLRDLAFEHMRAKYHQLAHGDNMIILSQEAEEEIDNDVSRLCNIAQAVSVEIQAQVNLEEFVDEWASFTLLNTFGICSLHALQRLCGTEDRVGYYPDLESVSEGRYRVYLFDRDENGNGSCETIRRFAHILFLQRVAQGVGDGNLPSNDFMTLLEEELLQCAQFHTDMSALEMHKLHAIDKTPIGIPEFGYVHEHAEEVLTVSHDAWNAIDIKGREDAWKLPIIYQISHLAANHFGIERDDLMRATAICWNGCPECVVSDHMLMGMMRGRDYVDKAILDNWFRIGLNATKEYKLTLPVDVAQGKAGLGIGTVSRLCLTDTKSLLRSVSLPFTIGMEINRASPSEPTHLLIRDNDIIGMGTTGQARKGIARAVPIGFGRLVWYNLLMTAYLDSIGQIKPQDKRILMVFYDMRDIPLNDVGMSERMWESLEHHRKASDFSRRLERLSDLLGWLATRDFKITICVDEVRSREKKVREFFERLHELEPSGKNIDIRTKKPKGIMHVKGMVTPLGAIDGSSNLTFMGINMNEESINYANVGSPDYLDVERNLKDKLHGSIPWRI